jgi:hypothetical protein
MGMTSTHEQRAATLTTKATWVIVDKMVALTATEEGDVIVRFLGTDGAVVATRVIPEIQWSFLRKIVH